MSRFFNINDAIELRLLGNSDNLRRDKLRLRKWSKFVWQDLNLTVVKKSIRKKFKINKRTNSVEMPCEFLQLSSVNVEICGIEYPVYRNNRITKDDDIVDVGATKDCGCEFNCGYKMCNTIKGYEAVQHTEDDKNPDGSDVSFDCVDRKGIDDQGFFYEIKQYPKRIYESSIWVSTILYTETNKLCKVEVDDNGCCCDTEANIDAVCDACGIHNVNNNLCCIGGTANCPPATSCDTWTYYCNSKLDWFSVQCGAFPFFRKDCNNIYNVSELGDKLIFPHNFGHDSVIVRWYEDSTINDIHIPVIALDTFILGLMWWDCRFNDQKQGLAERYGIEYGKLKWGLLKELNKYRTAELAMITTPPIYVPSYFRDRTSIAYFTNYVNNVW